MTVRLHLLCSASTTSVRSTAFAADEPLDAQGRESFSRLSGRLPSFDFALRSPARCAEQTAAGLSLAPAVEARLRDCDFGRWAGQSFTELEAREPVAIANWLHDPHAAPHGGESFADVLKRVGGWMDEILTEDGSLLAITHALVIRAAIAHALGAGPDAFRHVDVAPLTKVRFSGGGGRWTLVSLVSPKDMP
jgi:broad specificity phosphatase PhoE